MRYLIDTNILLYAANGDCSEHRRAMDCLNQLADRSTPWCLTWGIIYEFLRVSTHARVFSKPLKSSQAVKFLQGLLEGNSSPVTVIHQTSRHFTLLGKTLNELSHPA